MGRGGQSLDRGQTLPGLRASAADALPLEGSSSSEAHDLRRSRSLPLSVIPKLFRRSRSVAGIDQTRLFEPWEVADPDSRFAEYRQVLLHYKIAEPQGGSVTSTTTPEEIQKEEGVDRVTAEQDAAAEARMADKASALSAAGAKSGKGGAGTGLPVILLHGFGASTFSWKKILHPLARLQHAPALAFDRPAFGLSARVKVPPGRRGSATSLNPYSVAFSAAATVAFVEFVNAQKAVLVAHSAGALVALSAYLQDPDKVAAIVLIAPAIVAKKSSPPSTAKSEEKHPRSRGGILGGVLGVVKAVAGEVSAVVSAVSRWVQNIGRLVLAGIMALILRSAAAAWALRATFDIVGDWIVRFAWHDEKECTKDVLDAYKKPLMIRGWEAGLLEFVLSTLGHPQDSSSGQDPRSLSQRLGEVKCPVLVLTGDNDRIVPAWNAHRVAEALPNASCRVIRNCGHLPQEEKPAEVLATIEEFLQERVSEGGLSLAAQ